MPLSTLAQLRAAAVDALDDVCTALGRPLDTLLLTSGDTRLVLEYVGRCVQRSCYHVHEQSTLHVGQGVDAE